MKRLLEDAKKLIRINSVTTNGNEELANFVSSLLQNHGLKTQLQQVTHSLENVSKRQFNVIGVLGDPLVDRKTKKGLLLNTHLDTVSPGLVENWSETGNDPFQMTVKDGKIFGLGSVDVKLDFLCKLYAIDRFRERKFKQPVYLVGTCGEEMGMFGAKYLIKSLALNPKYVLVGEPSSLKVVVAHKCLNIFKISFDYQQIERDARGFNRKIDLVSLGKSAHGSYPHLGNNAILQMLEFLQNATDSGFEIRFTRIAGGDSKNKVPDQASCEFYLTSHQFEDFKRFYRERLRAEGKEKSFRAELGGLGDTGVRFLPEGIYSALIEATQFFKKLGEELLQTKDETYNPSHSTVNIGVLEKRPTGLDLYCDLRLLPTISPEEIEKKITEGIKAIALKHSQLNIFSTRERMNPGLNMSMDQDLVRICREAMRGAGIEPQFDKKATSTEAAQYFQAGFDAVVFGPGVSMGNSHSPNEHNLIDHLEKAVNFYEKVIEKVCL